MSSLTPDGNPSFKGKRRKKKAKDRVESTSTNLGNNSNRTANPGSSSRIEAIKDAGKSFISKFFRGFEAKERANITADVDDRIIYRIIEHYQQAIRLHAEYEEYENSEKFAKDLDKKFLGAISLGFAIKLHLSSTDIEQKINRPLSCLETKISLPKKLGVLLDQIGKVDLAYDNHFRIRNQNIAAKRNLVRSIFFLLPKDSISDYIEDTYGLKWNDLSEIMEKPDLFTNMVDDTPWSVNRLQQIGKQIYEVRTDENFEFWDKSGDPDNPDLVRYNLRLPTVNFEKLDISVIKEVINNAIFEEFGFDQQKMNHMAYGLVLSVTKLYWLRNPTKKMGELDKQFLHTWFQDKTFKEIMSYCNVWNVSYYFNEANLNNLGLLAADKWNNEYSRVFNHIFNMNEIPFSNLGSDAQLVQVEKSNINLDNGIMGYPCYSFKEKVETKTVLKPSENGTLLGLMMGYIDNIKFKADWNVEFGNTNDHILYEFLRNDFKDKYD